MERRRNNLDIITNGYIEFSFLRNFKFKSSVNARLINTRFKEFRPSTLAGRGFDQPPPREANLDQGSGEPMNVAADQILTYARTIGDHDLSIMAGFSAKHEPAQGLRASDDAFTNDITRIMQE